ncbi:MAG: hypothetical protein ACR2IN_03470, partial [Thermoleophilaceae bacterium]
MSFLPRLGRSRTQENGASNGGSSNPDIPGALRRGGNGNGSENGTSNGSGDAGNGLIDRTALKKQATEVPVSMLGWLDERSGASPFLRGFMFRKVPKGTNWFYTLGSATMFAFVVQALTGVFLAMYYTPSPVEAYSSITHLTNDVFMG